MLRAATCTPINFPSDPHFWGRDTGLLCSSLCDAGIDCMCIMPGPQSGIDAGGVLRASFPSMESPEWWRNHQLDFVVIYAWGDPRYIAIARAIREAGIFLIQNLDSAGINTPYSDFKRWWISLSGLIAGPQPMMAKARLTARMARDLFPSLFESKRLDMLEEADVIAVVSPQARNSIHEYVTALKRGHLSSRIQVIPHAVPASMNYDGRSKTKSVICVGRWNQEDWHQKNPELTLKVALAFCKSHTDWTFEIIGRGANELPEKFRLNALPSNLIFTPQMDRIALRERYLDAALIFCASRYESYHIASAEAVCCGCRVVVPRHPLLASTAWFTQQDSGTIAVSHRTADLLDALTLEVSRFDPQSKAAPLRSTHWSNLLTGPAVAKTILHILESQPLSQS